jgi:RHS repeat-associated protein
MGNRTAECDPESRATNWRYDVRGRQIFAINNLGQTTTYAYDGNGNRTAETKPKGNSTESATCGYSDTLAATYPGDSANHTWHYGYDSADRLTSVTDGNGEQTRYTHNYLDLRTSHTDALNQTTAMAYDAVGNLVSVTYADGEQEQYTAYDGNGNLKAMTDAKGSVVSYDYDPLNRETQRSFTPITPLAQEVLQVATAYDKNGNVVTLTETDNVGDTRVTTQAHDRFDRLIRREDSFGKVTNYAYDNNGNRTQLTDPDLNVTRYTFDKLNRVSTVTNLQGTTTYTYDKSGLRRKVEYPSRASMTYTYDPVGRTASITHTQNSATVSVYGYEYDAHGNRTRQEEENGRGEEISTYAYDNLDRLTEVTYPDVPVGTSTTVLYRYDAAYNRTGETTLNVAATTIADKTYRYNSRNQLTAVDDNLNPAQNVTYAFDANGNQTGKTKAAVETDFVYDVRDHLRSVTTGGSTLGQFLYDYRGMRIEKDGARGIERYSYDDQSVLTQFDDTGATLAKFEYGGNRLISLNSLANGLQFYHFDALGSPVTLTKADGSVQARYSYDAWGHKRHQSGESWNRFGFTGHEHDEETNLIYAKARYYDPDTGRFLSEDPWEGDATIAPSLNKYLYAYQNPIVWIDPTGMWSVLPQTQPDVGQWNPKTGKWEAPNGKQYQPSWRGAVKNLRLGIFFVPLMIGGDSHDSTRPPPEWLAEEVQPQQSPVHNPNTREGRERFAEDNPGVTDARAGTAPPAQSNNEQGAQITVESSSSGTSDTVSIDNPAPKNEPTHASGVDDDNDGSLYDRPSGFRKSTLEGVEEQAPRSQQGEMICPTCGEVMPETITVETRNGPIQRRGYDVDHYPLTWSERVGEMKEQEIPPTRKEVIDEYNRDVRAQCPGCNQGHKYEGIEGDYAK